MLLPSVLLIEKLFADRPSNSFSFLSIFPRNNNPMRKIMVLSAFYVTFAVNSTKQKSRKIMISEHRKQIFREKRKKIIKLSIGPLHSSLAPANKNTKTDSKPRGVRLRLTFFLWMPKVNTQRRNANNTEML